MTTTSPDMLGHTLAVPDLWVVEPIVQRRLARQLARHPSWVSAVVAPGAPLSPGASFRSYAEHRALQPLSELEQVPAGEWLSGAVLVREGVEHEVSTRGVRVGEGTVLIDRGAHSHDPWAEMPQPAPAALQSRSPFPWRPVVAFVAAERDLDLIDWARELVNDLLRIDIEARLVAHDVPTGLALSAPCLPGPTSIRVLAPDVVVALDETALRRCPLWCAPSRTTTMIEYRAGVGEPIELVSWRIGVAQGRLRARINRSVGADELAGLVNRLTSGPQPMAPNDLPIDPDQTATRVVVRTHLRAEPLSITLLRGILDTAGEARVSGLHQRLEEGGSTVRAALIDSDGLDACRNDDVVIAFGCSQAPGIAELFADRSSQRLVSVIDVGASDVDPGTGEPTDAAQALITAAGRCTTPTKVLHDALEAAGLNTLWLPMLLDAGRVSDLRFARDNTDLGNDPDRLALAWHLGADRRGDPAVLEAVASAITTIRGPRRALRLDLVGDVEQLDSDVVERPQTIVHSREIDASRMRLWSAQIWTPSAYELRFRGDLRNFVEPTYVGVPTVCSIEASEAVGGPAMCDTTVADPTDAEEWLSVLEALLGESAEAHAQRRTRLMRRVQTLHGPHAVGDVVARLLGWLAHGQEG